MYASTLWVFTLVSQRYSGLKDWISQYVRKDDNILMVGCGNSRLSEEMFDDGFTTLTNIDVSRVVVEQMIARYRCGMVAPDPSLMICCYISR